MIPLQLQLKNFLSYGPDLQTIDFSAYPLICLSGKNGHGKSALLDAITWALWGQARKVSGSAKADQGLLRLGQTQMMVSLDFICNGQEYRVRREFALTYGKPFAALDFGLLNSKEDTFIPLTDKTMRETQAKIENMLHLTYDAFINSAFLRQGQSNEFSKKSPRDRKDILASILGLDQYECIRKRAAEKIKSAQTQKQYLMTHQESLKQELASDIALQNAMHELHEKETILIKDEENSSQKYKDLQQQKEILQLQEQELQLLTYQQQQLLNQEKKLKASLLETRNHWRIIHRQQLQAIDYQALENQKKEILEKIKEYQQQLHEQLTHKEQLLHAKEQFSLLCNQFQEKNQKQGAEKKVALERLLLDKQYHIQQQDFLKKNLNTASAFIAQKIKESEQENKKNLQLIDLTSFEKQFEKRKEHYQKWIATANQIKIELESIGQKQDLVDHEQSPSCPLCEQNLSASRRKFLVKKFDDTKLFLEKRFHRLSLLIKALKNLLLEQHKKLETDRLHNKENEKQANTIQELQKIIEQKKAEELELQAQLTKIAEIIEIIQATIAQEELALQNFMKESQNSLQEDESYKKLRTLIEKIEKILSDKKYDSKAHEQLNQQQSAIEQQINSYHALQQQILLQKNRSQDIHSQCAQLKQVKKEIIMLAQNSEKFSSLPAMKKNLVTEESKLAEQQVLLKKEKEIILHQKGNLQARKTALAKINDDFLAQQKEISNCEKIIDDYQAIALATSKDGIQALLIEDAIPEIEQETNDLLSKLTDNQTQLFIESLRDLKKGGVKETLDIKISDASGIRPYELFSGGEAFRIDFALRIAISKLLARRAGTSLQTLIIDEGFGSQDEEGLIHIMDALYKIQDDFAKIIIVSHLQSMKNQFPIHFHVEKGANGSTIQVLEQG